VCQHKLADGREDVLQKVECKDDLLKQISFFCLWPFFFHEFHNEIHHEKEAYACANERKQESGEAEC